MRQKNNSTRQAIVDSSAFGIQKTSNSGKETLFYCSLRDVFIGAKVEGESGYVNLMAIKSRYYENGVFPRLKQDVEGALKDFPHFREELFDKLYTFFHRYFSESGSIYYLYTPLHQNIYEKVYTDDKDVILFWKTHMLYYVKTDRLFKNLQVELDGCKFFFDVSTLEHKKANEKREIIYEFKKKREDGTLVFSISYSERGRKTKFDEILKELKKDGQGLSEELLEQTFRVFERQSEVDYFINKNAKAFLQEQFNLWLYQYVFSGESEWTEVRIRQLQALKDIAFKIIDFISQFENELVKIWNKPKFVLNSNYVITLDRIVSAHHSEHRPTRHSDPERSEGEESLKLVEKILNHKNFNEQVKEWKELGIVDSNFRKTKVIETDLTGKHLNDEFKYLPVDTRYFKDIEPEILGLFEALDNSLDGWLIKGENYQALNTILPKFKEKVQTIYIDPPFNKEQDADYFYSVKYKDATWVTILENRLQVAKDILKETGSIFVRCDDNGNMYVRLLMNEVFGERNFRNEIVVNKSIRIKTKGNKFPTWHDSFYFYSKNGDDSFFRHITERRMKEEWRSMDTEGESWEIVPEKMLKLFSKTNLKRDAEENYITRARIILGKEIVPREGRRFPSQKVILELEKQGRLRLSESNNPQMLKPSEIYLTDNWSDIYGYASEWDFPTENSELGAKRCIESTSKEGDLVLDFFEGIGTTPAVAHKLGRKWIGVEIGEHFYRFETNRLPSGILIRMKEVLASKGNHEPCGISKEVNWQGGASSNTTNWSNTRMPCVK